MDGEETPLRALSASLACQRLFHEALGFELEHADELGHLHQFMVDAYGAQHPLPPTPTIRVYYSLVGLHLAIDQGWTGLKVRDAHQRMGKPAGWWPVVHAPKDRGVVTIAQVAAAGMAASSPAGHKQLVTEWGRSVWAAWKAEHAAIRDLTRALVKEMASR